MSAANGIGVTASARGSKALSFFAMRARRWDLTEHERALINRRARFGVRELVGGLRQRPRLIARLFRVAAASAVAGVRSDHELANFLIQRRVRAVAPDTASGVIWRGERFFVDVLLERLDPRAEVLEIGCGAGRIARHVASRVQRLVGVDISKTMIMEGAENLSAHANVALKQVEGFALDGLADESFDVVYAHDLFCLLEPIETLASLDAIARVLRPGGESILSFYALDCPAWREGQLADARTGARSGHWGANIPRPYTAEFIRSLYELAGFDVVDEARAWEREEVVATGKVNELAHYVAVGRRRATG